LTQFEQHAWSEGFPAFRDIWAALATQLQLNPSLGPEWVDLSLNAHQLRENASLLVVRDRGAARAVVPLFTRTQSLFGVPLRMLEPGFNITAYHPSLIAAGFEDQVAEYILGGMRGWDAFRFHAAVDPGKTLDALRAAARRLGLYWRELPGDRSPYLAIDRPLTEFLAAKSSSFRYNLQRKAKKFQKVPGARIEWIETASDLNQVMERILDIEAASWKAGQGVAINQNAAERAYYEALLPALAARNALVMNLLFIGEQPVAYSLCCHVGNWMGLLKTSFKSAYGDTAAGNFSMNEMMRHAFESGASEFDFLGGDDKYKLEWSSGLRAHVDFLCFSGSPRGRLAGVIARTRATLRALADRRQAKSPAEQDTSVT
jgi:CelD/BcsL family acetyltransferase involved in cellulose biosynthesis